MQKRAPNENKLKKFSSSEILITDISNYDEALAHIYFKTEKEKTDNEYLKQVLLDLGWGKQYAIFVVPAPGNKYKLLYGQKRLYAAVYFERTVIEVNVISSDTQLDYTAIEYLFKADYSSRTSYEKGQLFAEVLKLTGKKFEELGVQTGLSYHTLRSLDSAYKTAQKYPVIKEAYQNERIHQGIVNLAASLYKQLPNSDDQQKLTDYLAQTKDSGFRRLKKAVESQEDKPVRERILDYIAADLKSIENGEGNAIPDSRVDPNDIIDPILPGDVNGPKSFTPIFGFPKGTILLFQDIYRELKREKQKEALSQKTKTQKVSKTVLKIFYLLCRDRLIYIDSRNLRKLDQLWETNAFPDYMGRYYNNFEDGYRYYKMLEETYGIIFYSGYSSILAISNTDNNDFDLYRKYPSINLPDGKKERLVYCYLISYFEKLGFKIESEPVINILDKYCKDEKTVQITQKLFECVSRYQKMIPEVKLGIAEILDVI